MSADVFVGVSVGRSYLVPKLRRLRGYLGVHTSCGRFAERGLVRMSAPGHNHMELEVKWLLVVIVMNSPVKTDLVFNSLSDCLAAENQMRREWADQ